MEDKDKDKDKVTKSKSPILDMGFLIILYLIFVFFINFPHFKLLVLLFVLEQKISYIWGSYIDRVIQGASAIASYKFFSEWLILYHEKSAMLWPQELVVFCVKTTNSLCVLNFLTKFCQDKENDKCGYLHLKFQISH